MQLTEYWTYHRFPMSLYPRLPCGFVRESESHSCYSGWLVGWCCARLAAGRLSQAPSDGEWIFKQCWAAIRKSVWDLCPFVLGLTASSKLRPVAGIYGLRCPPTPSHKTYTHDLSALSVLFAVRSVDGFQWRDCPPHSLLKTKDGDHNNKPGCLCSGTSAGLSSLITF